MFSHLVSPSRSTFIYHVFFSSFLEKKKSLTYLKYITLRLHKNRKAQSIRVEPKKPFSQWGFAYNFLFIFFSFFINPNVAAPLSNKATNINHTFLDVFRHWNTDKQLSKAIFRSHFSSHFSILNRNIWRRRELRERGGGAYAGVEGKSGSEKMYHSGLREDCGRGG